ncbi:uncharacterized protein ACNLHF_012490 isoform 2-T2 [Anomaloglossus baeobatrachus]
MKRRKLVSAVSEKMSEKELLKGNLPRQYLTPNSFNAMEKMVETFGYYRDYARWHTNVGPLQRRIADLEIPMVWMSRTEISLSSRQADHLQPDPKSKLVVYGFQSGD